MADNGSENLIGRFMVLRGAARELWITFAFKILGLLAYGLMNPALVLWLSYDLGYNDLQAGNIILGWSAAMTLFNVLVGSLSDAIGLRKTFLLGIWICIVARAIMTFFTAKWFVLVCGMLPLAMGEALGAPVTVAAIRRYSTTAQRSISFSIFYALMNVALFAANLIFDFVRKHVGEPHGRLHVPMLGVELTTYQTLFLCSLVVEAVLLAVVYFGLREGVEVTDEGLKIQREIPKHKGKPLWTALRMAVRDTVHDSTRIFTGLWRQSGFYRFLGFLGLAAFVRLIMIHMYYTYPKFGLRELGPGAPVGHLWAINQFIIIFLVPLVGAYSQRISAYRMVTVGSAVAAASVFIMALPPVWFESLARNGAVVSVAHAYLGLSGAVNPYYVMIFLFVVMLSIGEAIYSPRLYEYAAAIAPKGQEASYMSMSYLPFFLAKLLVAGTSGLLLEQFCPETGPRDSAMLWFVIALTTSVAPVGLVLLRRFIRVSEAGRPDS